MQVGCAHWNDKACSTEGVEKTKKNSIVTFKRKQNVVVASSRILRM